MSVLGFNTIGTTNDDHWPGNLSAYGPFVAPQNGTLSNILVYCNDVTKEYLTMGIYSDSGGAPSSLLAVTTGGQDTDGVGWKMQPISLSVTSGTSYWLALNTSAAHATTLKYSSVSGKYHKYKAEAYSDGSMPSTFPSSPSSSPNVSFSIYATFNITFSPDSIACSVFPQTMTAKAARKSVVDSRSIAATSQTVAGVVARTMPCTTRAYAVTNRDATMYWATGGMTSETQTYLITVTDTEVSADRKISCTSRAVTVTRNDARIVRGITGTSTPILLLTS